MYNKIILLLFLLSVTYAKNTCNILALSGGGSFGAVQVGIISDLIEKQQIVERYDILTGISAGGLNVGFMSYYKNISTGIDKLTNIYLNLKNSDIYKDEFFGLKTSWSIYSTSPLEKTIKTIIKNKYSESDVPITLIGSTNLNSQQLDIWEYNNYNYNDKVNIMMATSAIPIVFPPRIFNNTIYVDGGVIDNEIIFQAMGRLKCDDYKVDFISASNRNIEVQQITGFIDYVKAVGNLIINTYNYQLAELESITCLYPLGHINVYYPNDTKLDKYSILDFDHSKELIEIGKNNYVYKRFDLC